MLTADLVIVSPVSVVEGGMYTTTPESAFAAGYPWARALAALLVVLLAARASLAGLPCIGDCDGDEQVSISELITGVNMALGLAPVAQCAAFDSNGDQQVGITELVTAVNAALGSCAGTPRVTDFVTEVRVVGLDIVGVVRGGSLPAPSNGPAVEAPDTVTVINGGTTQLMLSAPQPFATAYVAVASAPGLMRGAFGDTIDGFFEVRLPEAVTQVVLQITVKQEPANDVFAWNTAVATAKGAVGSPAQTAVQLLRVGTGDVQVSVSWDTLADVDLHVVEPSGEEIFYAHPISATGAVIDLDSNAACTADGINNENITWPSGMAPSGTYIVRVDYYAACDNPETHYIVTVQRTGMAAETFAGRFTGPGDEGGMGAGATVTQFTF
jgi:hypothetical protein